jgi:UDP:flavonoid glycosyltransferase YjiC (YdhE family)
VCEALTRGLPLIVAPIRDDQPVVARQVIDAGAALFMRYGKVTPAAARSAIEKLFSTPALVAAARTLGQTLREAPGAAGAAALIAELIAPGLPRQRVN